MSARLAISNIAWPAAQKPSIYAALGSFGVDGLELALTKFAPWDRLDEAILRTERDEIDRSGLTVCAYQAILFGTADCDLLKSEANFHNLRAHIGRFAQLAHRMSGGGIAVFGAPRNRQRGALGGDDAFVLGAERLRLLADDVAPLRVTLALESAPAAYGGDFLERVEDCALMVEAVGRPGLRLHLDAGCLSLSDEDPAAILERWAHLVGHVHCSEPRLLTFEAPSAKHHALAAALERVNYSGWISIEMAETPDPIASIESAAAFARATYAVG